MDSSSPSAAVATAAGKNTPKMVNNISFASTEHEEEYEEDEQLSPKEAEKRHSIFYDPASNGLPDDACCAKIRRPLVKVFHSTAFNISVIVMASLDGLILLAVLMLEIEILQLEHGELHTSLENCRFALEIVSLMIISVFAVELFLRIFAVGPKLLKHWIEVLDGLITLGSLGIDIYVVVSHVQSSRSATSNALTPVAGLLILFRLWRVIRIVNATIVSLSTGLHNQLSTLKQKCNRMRQRIHQLKDFIRENDLQAPSPVYHYNRRHRPNIHLPQPLLNFFSRHRHHNGSQNLTSRRTLSENILASNVVDDMSRRNNSESTLVNMESDNLLGTEATDDGIIMRRITPTNSSGNSQ